MKGKNNVLASSFFFSRQRIGSSSLSFSLFLSSLAQLTIYFSEVVKIKVLSDTKEYLEKRIFNVFDLTSWAGTVPKNTASIVSLPGTGT